MKLFFLGTNGWYDTQTGNTPCILIDSKDFYLILDCGNGAYKLKEYFTKEKPVFLFISHFHLDHLIGFHHLFKHEIKDLKIYTQKGGQKLLKTLISHPFTKSLKEWNYPPKIIEVDEGNYSLPFKTTCRKLFHTPSDFGFRFKLENKTIVYSGDTGICDNDYQLCQNADILIHECSWLTQTESKWGHTTAEEAAALASKAKVKQLILTHFDASVFTTFKLRREAQKRARMIFRNTLVAKDGLIISC